MSTPSAARAMEVLAVDDDPSLLALEAHVLGRAGYVVESAAGGAEAIERLQAHPPDLVLLDIMMPDISGWDVLRHVSTMTAPPAVVLVSGLNEVGLPAELRQYTTAYLRKPFDPARLLQTCQSALAGPRGRERPRGESTPVGRQSLPMDGAARVTFPWRVSFDRALVAAPFALAAAGAALVVAKPVLFPIIFVLDLWLLAFPHVIATFTRVAFDAESFARHRFLAVGLPPLIAAAIVALFLWNGYTPIATLYFYGQWFHYTRQSYGMERILWRKAAGTAAESSSAAWLLYLVAAWGVLRRSHEAQPSFLGMKLAWLPVPEWMVLAAGAAAALALAVWLVTTWQTRAGRLRHTAYVVTHVAVFVLAYRIIPDVSHGWLLINIWHNAQYMMIVWYFNATRFRDGVDPRHTFLSTISQPRNASLFVLVCLGCSLALYLPIHYLVPAIGGFPVAVVLAQLLNFHHYVVDARVWRLRHAPVRAGLGLA